MPKINMHKKREKRGKGCTRGRKRGRRRRGRGGKEGDPGGTTTMAAVKAKRRRGRWWWRGEGEKSGAGRVITNPAMPQHRVLGTRGVHSTCALELRL